jgi:IS30 family transposase
MGNYTHLGYEERIKIETLLNEGYAITRISDRLSRSKSTIYRESKKKNYGKANVKWKDWSIKTGYKNAPKYPYEYDAKHGQYVSEMKKANSHKARKILPNTLLVNCYGFSV